MALILAEALRTAQSQARSLNAPVAVTIPSQGATLATSQSFYFQEGQVFPRVTKVTQLGGEFPQGCLTVASWARSDGGWAAPAPVQSSQFTVAGWSSRYPGDPAIIFLPGGEVTSNGIPQCNGKFHIVANGGALVSPSGSVNGGPRLFSISQVTRPVTVSVSSRGAVSVEEGLTGASSALVSPVGLVGSLAQPPSLSRPPSQVPQLLGVNVSPLPEQTISGIDALVAQDGRLTLQARAWSPEGYPLYVSWSGPGKFSSAGPVPMVWSPGQAEWVGELDWSPPAGVAAGSNLRLECKVEDRYGNQIAIVSSNGLNIRVGQRIGHLLYEYDHKLWSSLSDGSGKVELPAKLDPTEARWSPDGRRVLYEVGTAGVSSGEIWLLSPEAGNLRKLADGHQAMWSPDGTRIVYRKADKNLALIRADGSGYTQLTTYSGSGSGYYNPRWKPDGTQILAMYDTSLYDWETRVLNLDGTVFSQIANPGGSGRSTVYPAWSPDGQWIGFYYFEDAWICHPDGTNMTQVWSVGPGYGGGMLTWGGQTGCMWSYDGRYFCFKHQVNVEGPQPRAKIIDFNTKSMVFSTPSLQYPVWSPRSHQFVTTAPVTVNGVASTGVVTMDWNGANPTVVQSQGTSLDWGGGL